MAQERALTADERIELLVDAAPPLSDELSTLIHRILQPVVTR